MEIEGLEKRINNRGGITYWKDGTMVGKKCSKCGKDKEVSEFSFFNKKKGTYRPECKGCEKQYREANREIIRERGRMYYETNKEIQKEKNKLWNEKNKEYRREYHKRYDEVNKERRKQYREANKEHKKEKSKQWYENNKEHKKEYCKQKYENNKQNNLQYISAIAEQINPIFKQLNLPTYGYIYMFENIKTRHKYVGQSIKPIRHRYHGNNIVQGWIKERSKYNAQKFKDELIEENFIVIETLDVAFCQYHLDKLEAYYIDKYDSFLNGYNNREGNHKTNDGLEEFNKILKENNLEFINGKLIKIV